LLAYPGFLWITLLIAGLTGPQSLKNQDLASTALEKGRKMKSL
jgi:ABC-type transport system involved in cytochrome c biogenesis permease component